jgi:hypothetical protein
MQVRFLLSVLVVAFMTFLAAAAHAQAAGAGADFNRAERAQIQERTRLERVDPPIKPDPVGNAIIGGVVGGVIKGVVTSAASSIGDAVKAGAAAGALSTARGAAVGTAAQAAKEDILRNKEQNLKSGRGGPDDPRYKPATLFNR